MYIEYMFIYNTYIYIYYIYFYLAAQKHTKCQRKTNVEIPSGSPNNISSLSGVETPIY